MPPQLGGRGRVCHTPTRQGGREKGGTAGGVLRVMGDGEPEKRRETTVCTL